MLLHVRAEHQQDLPCEVGRYRVAEDVLGALEALVPHSA